MSISLVAKIAPIMDENPHMEVKGILDNLKTKTIENEDHVQMVHDELYHLLHSVLDHDAEEEAMMECIYYPDVSDHILSHHAIVGQVRNTIRVLQHTTSIATPEWAFFHTQMGNMHSMIEDHMRVYDNPLLLSIAQHG